MFHKVTALVKTLAILINQNNIQLVCATMPKMLSYSTRQYFPALNSNHSRSHGVPRRPCPPIF